MTRYWLRPEDDEIWVDPRTMREDVDPSTTALAAVVAARVVEEMRRETVGGLPRVLADFDEAARMLGITRAALEKRVQRHQLPPGAIVRTGHRVQFHVDRLRAMKPARTSRR